MSDFLIKFGPDSDSRGLLDFLRLPYGNRPRLGQSFDYSWGGIALLADPCVHGKNYLRAGDLTFGWVGDLAWTGRDCLAAPTMKLERELTGVTDPDAIASAFKHLFPFASLKGAGAVFVAAPSWVCIVTDPMSAVQVYRGENSHGAISAAGTHPDLVARCAKPEDDIDPVSACEFVNYGTPCFPFTMHQHVRELAGGKAHLFAPTRRILEYREVTYWTPPREVLGKESAEDFSTEFTRRWQEAVIARCDGQRTGVQLSGGLDSRLVIALIPRDLECLAFTFCDRINREARIAQEVAACYARKWITLQRDPEYVAQTAVDCIRLTGCEGEWHHAHASGFASDFEEWGLSGLFTGLYMDNNFKGYYARDLKRISRAGGLLPARFEPRRKDYSNQMKEFCRRHIKSELADRAVTRRQQFYQSHFARGRQSEWEWLDGYPLTQASDNTGWIVERRLIPMRLPVMDRALVDLALQIPAQMKAGGTFFGRAASLVLGSGNRIPNANDGVRPGSGNLSRIAQRAMRKFETSARGAVEKLGWRTQVPHSWHDYSSYWRESVVLQQLRATHGKNLLEFEGTLFNTPAAELLAGLDRDWRVNYRFLQLAIWRTILKDYRLPAGWPGASRPDLIATN